jgi:hypothetical protein
LFRLKSSRQALTLAVIVAVAVVILGALSTTTGPDWLWWVAIFGFGLVTAFVSDWWRLRQGQVDE